MRSADSGCPRETHPCVGHSTEPVRRMVLTRPQGQSSQVKQFCMFPRSRLSSISTSERGLACAAKPLAPSRFQIHMSMCCVFSAEARPTLHRIPVGWPSSAGRVFRIACPFMIIRTSTSACMRCILISCRVINLIGYVRNVRCRTAVLATLRRKLEAASHDWRVLPAKISRRPGARVTRACSRRRYETNRPSLTFWGTAKARRSQSDGIPINVTYSTFFTIHFRPWHLVCTVLRFIAR